MRASVSNTLTEHTFIEVVECAGEWFVRVVEQGHENVYSFELEALARAYAEGQRVRLGLKSTIGSSCRRAGSREGRALST